MLVFCFLLQLSVEMFRMLYFEREI